MALGLADAEAVAAAAHRHERAGAFLVEEMVTGGVAELLVGVVRDPAHGFVLTLGAGRRAGRTDGRHARRCCCR